MRREPVLGCSETEHGGVEAHEHGARGRYELGDAHGGLGAPPRVGRERGLERRELGEQRAIAAGQQPHAKAATSTSPVMSALRPNPMR